MKKILVINVNWVGDVIFSSPVFKALNENYPHAKIFCLAPPRVKEVLESIPFVDGIIPYDEKGKHRSIFAKINLILKLRREKFDAAFILHRSLTKALFACLAGIKQRIGYDTKGRGKLLTHPIKEPKEQLHRSDYYLNVIEAFGVKVNDRKTFLSISVEADREIREILDANGIKDNDFTLAVNPGGNWGLKRWPKENFKALLRKLAQDKNIKIIITGAEKDIDLAEELAKGLEVKPLILAGRTSLKQLVALFKRTDLVVSADSGPLHLANSVGAKTIALFGPTSVKITGPRGVGKTIILQHDVGCNREACYFLECPSNLCMQAITAEEVWGEVAKVKKEWQIGGNG